MRRFFATGTLAFLALAAPAAGEACTLELREQRSGRSLLQVPLPTAGAPAFAVAFEHSVLGHTVVDRYEVRPHGSGWRSHLVEERFDGEGYGLPYAAIESNERMTREAGGWSLSLDRVVDPLVVRPLRAQATRLQVAAHEFLLADLSERAIEMKPAGCRRF